MMSKLFRAAALAAAFVIVFAVPAVHAIEAQDEFDAAARKGAIKLGELTVFRSFVNAARMTFGAPATIGQLVESCVPATNVGMWVMQGKKM